VIDDIGEYYGWWSYPHKLIPFISQFDAVEFAVVPVTITLIYQIFNAWRKYLISGMIISFIYAFIGLPLFVYLGITKLNNWNYFKSFLVLIVTCILVKIITDFIARMNHQLNQPEHEGRKFSFSFFQSKKKAR
jgi:Ca2+/H+ antiporter